MNANSGQFKYLGQPNEPSISPETFELDRLPNPHVDTVYSVRFTAPEFTSLCPVTGQPDFAHIVIDFVPHLWLVESKSLKLYLGSFRNHGAFHEDCTVAIGKRLKVLLDPHYLRLAGYWYPRGGIPIDVFWQDGICPKEVWLPDQGVAPYRGRG
jgi:7-cyano-7-deazaguanine reductase